MRPASLKAGPDGRSGWAAPSVAPEGLLRTLQEGLPVRLIATPRPNFRTCRTDEEIAAVIHRNVERFDYMPVMEAGNGRPESIIGLVELAGLEPSRSVSGRVAEFMSPLCEENLIGADAGILSFIKTADQKPCRLVVSGSFISGLVSLSDLQKLPVRAALFALITHLEITMTEAIRRECDGDPAVWKTRLSENRVGKIEEEICKSKGDDSWVEDLLFTQFCDKTVILKKSECFREGGKAFEREMSRAQDLRDALAHANDYAASRADAALVCQTVRDIEKWVDYLTEWQTSKRVESQRA